MRDGAGIGTQVLGVPGPRLRHATPARDSSSRKCLQSLRRQWTPHQSVNSRETQCGGLGLGLDARAVPWAWSGPSQPRSLGGPEEKVQPRQDKHCIT